MLFNYLRDFSALERCVREEKAGRTNAGQRLLLRKLYSLIDEYEKDAKVSLSDEIRWAENGEFGSRLKAYYRKELRRVDLTPSERRSYESAIDTINEYCNITTMPDRRTNKCYQKF